MGTHADETKDVRPVRSLLRRLIAAPAMLSFVWPAFLIFGGYVAWHQWGAEYMNSRFYGIDPAVIQISPAPEYVRSDLVTQVYQDTAMEDLSLLDNQATAKIASAFAIHPWIKEVNSVRKLPHGKIDVRVEYRKPVAMFYTPKSRHPEYKGPGFFALDSEGVLLPQLPSKETLQYIHILATDPNVYPNGRLGSRFGNAKVEAAASLAAILAPYREQIQAKSIEFFDLRHVAVPQLEIVTASGKTKFWGSPPGMELPEEAGINAKLRALLQSGDEDIDLRMAQTKEPAVR